MPDEEYKTPGSLLDALSGHGVYDIALVEDELSKYGFTYNRATDKLGFHAGSERLGAASKAQVQRTMDRDPRGGVLNAETPESALMVDALSVSRAVHKLLMPGKDVPGDMYMGRGKGYRANVDSILAYEAITDPLTREH